MQTTRLLVSLLSMAIAASADDDLKSFLPAEVAAIIDQRAIVEFKTRMAPRTEIAGQKVRSGSLSADAASIALQNAAMDAFRIACEDSTLPNGAVRIALAGLPNPRHEFIDSVVVVTIPELWLIDESRIDRVLSEIYLGLAAAKWRVLADQEAPKADNALPIARLKAKIDSVFAEMTPLPTEQSPSDPSILSLLNSSSRLEPVPPPVKIDFTEAGVVIGDQAKNVALIPKDFNPSLPTFPAPAAKGRAASVQFMLNNYGAVGTLSFMICVPILAYYTALIGKWAALAIRASWVGWPIAAAATVSLGWVCGTLVEALARLEIGDGLQSQASMAIFASSACLLVGTVSYVSNRLGVQPRNVVENHGKTGPPEA